MSVETCLFQNISRLIVRNAEAEWMEGVNVNKVVSCEIEKIFNSFNELYFDNSLSLPLIKYGNNFYGALNQNAVTKNGSSYSHEMTLPVEMLNKTIDEIAACVLHNMIHEYDYVYEKKMASRGDTYHNQKFKLFAEKCGLSCEYTDKNGWITHTNDSFRQQCVELGFKKEWSKRYTFKSGKKDSSTVKYIDKASGESVRATKPNHILFCFDDRPEIAAEIEKKYGKKRMIKCE